MPETPRVPGRLRIAVSEKFSSDQEREAALWGWQVGFMDARDMTLSKALNLADEVGEDSDANSAGAGQAPYLG